MVTGTGASVACWLLSCSKQEEDNDAGEPAQGTNGRRLRNAGHPSKKLSKVQVTPYF